MKPWQRIVGVRPQRPAAPLPPDAFDPDADTRGVFDALRRSLAPDLVREPGSALLDRPSLETLLGAFIARAQARRGEIGLVALELEGAKALRADAADADFESAVAQMGHELRRCVRASDDVGRLGDAQFVAVLPGCEEQALQTVADRLRSSLEARELSLGAQRHQPTFLTAAIAAIPAHFGAPISPARALEALRGALDGARGAQAPDSGG